MIAFIIIIFILFFNPAFAEEQRCVELGTNCDCSETLDTTPPHYTVQSGGAPFMTNPTNSTGDKQCGGSSGLFLQGNNDPDIYLVPEVEQGMPTGNTVQTVWRWTTYGVDTGNGRTDKITSATRRLCQRVYMQFSSDFSLWADCNNKIMEMAWKNNGQLQSSTSVGGSKIMLNVGANFSGPDAGANHVPGPDTITPRECVNTWCRIELCVSGNIQAGTGLTADFFVSTTDGLLSASKTGIDMGNAPGSIDHLWPLNLYRETANGACNGTRAFSHIMQASWDTDAGQTIGPAYEVEGGGPASSPNGGALLLDGVKIQ